MPTALVTGAAGFTGKYVVNALARRGYRVLGIGLGEPSGSDWISCDLTDRAGTSNSLRGITPDVVVHLAAVAFVGEGNPENFYRVNVLGTLNLLEALAGADRIPSRILIASSANVYGNISDRELSEDICPAPVNHYAASKLAMEHMVRAWFDRLPIVLTRPFNYTGPGQDERFVVPKIVNHYKRRASSIRLGDTRVERDFSDVEDVVEAYMRLLESNVSSEIVNICSGRTISIASIIVQMNAIAGYPLEVATDPSLFRRNDLARLWGSNRKLQDLTGFAPKKPIQETLRRMYTGHD
jgi:nucleoside-diphosphate-sugar epimerase